MSPLPPIFLIDLLQPLDQKLTQLLQSLSPEDWQKSTVAPLWIVKDIAAHLLDGNIRTLSMLRDGYFGEKMGSIHAYQDLVNYLNRLNADWVLAMRRVSPGVLIELLKSTGEQYCDYLKTLDPFGKAAFSVAWAGEQESLNWFHIAREYTEKWHHQQQIRLAVSQEKELYESQWYFPYLDTSMRALPHHYRNIKAGQGSVVKVFIPEMPDGNWTLYYNLGRWQLVTDCPAEPVCTISIGPETAWRLFTKGISRQEAEKGVAIAGNQQLGDPIFSMLAVMG